VVGSLSTLLFQALRTGLLIFELEDSGVWLGVNAGKIYIVLHALGCQWVLLIFITAAQIAEL
jgi:hypothetical protein